MTKGCDKLVFKVMGDCLLICSFEYAPLRCKQEMIVVCSYHIEEGASFLEIESLNAFVGNIIYLQLTTSL